MRRLLPLLLVLVLPLALLADGTPVVTHDPSGNEITTTTTTTSTTNPDGTYTESTTTKVVVKNPAGNVIKKSTKVRDVKYKKKGGAQLKVSEGTSVDTYNLDGSSTTTITDTVVDSEHGTVDETVTKLDHAVDGTMTGERTKTHRAPGEKSETKERLTQNGKWEEISMAAPPSGDALLTSDPRFTRVKPAPGDGSGTDQGVYIAPLAHQGEITGTVVSDQAGPAAFYVATVTGNGDQQVYQSKTDDKGHFHLRIPAIVGLATILAFTEFDKQGKPDKGASCLITDKPTHLEGTEAAQNVPASGPAITEANTAYERGGFNKGLVQMQTRGTDPLHAKLLLDGSDKQIDTYGTSDMSIAGKLHDDTPLGRHTVGVQNDAQRLNDQQADVVTQQIAPPPSLKPGQVVPVHVHFDGLGKDQATVKFTVEGSASLADGSTTTVVPVSPSGDCQVQIRATEAGKLIIRTVLMVAVPPLAAAKTETPPPNAPVANPPPTETPPTHPPTTPSPTPTPTEFPTTREKPYGPGYRPPPCKPTADGAFEPVQGVWQDDPKFDDHPTKQITRPLVDVPNYVAELDMISYRDTLLFGIDRYRLKNGAAEHAWGHYTIQMTVVSDCSDPPVGVSMRFTLERGTATPGKLIYQSKELAKIPLTGHHVTPKTYFIFLDADEGIPPPPLPPFRIAAFGEYLIKDELVTANGGTGLAVTVGGNVHGTHSVKIAFLALTLTPADAGSAKAVDDASEQLGIMSGRYIPDYYPMQPHSIEAWALDPIDLSTSKAMTDPIEPLVFPGVKPEDQELDARITREIAVHAELSKQLDALTRLAGYQRYVVVLPVADMTAIQGKGVLGLAMTGKILLVREDQPYFVVMHELAHTLPMLWGDFQMNRDCSAPGNYHNMVVTWANGFRIDTAGVPGPREKKERKEPFMGSGDVDRYTWIAQCTYWNLASALRKKPDPPALLVRGLVSRAGGKAGALIWPYYDIDSEIQLESRSAVAGETWAIVYRDAGGAPLATFPFEPQWADENGKQSDVVPFSFQVPRMTGVASVELQGPNGFGLRRAVSQAPPVVHIATPGAAVRHAGSATIALSWSAAVTTGRQWSTVLYSSNGGASYDRRVFEEPVTSATIKIDPAAHAHRVKVIVTDGSQSTEQTLDFKT